LQEYRQFLGEVSNRVANQITKNPSVKTPLSNMSDLEFSFSQSANTIQKTAVNVAKRNNQMSLQTELANKALDSSIKSGNAATMALKTRKAAVRRNKKFEALTRSTVGVGLRKAKSATKGHTGF
jgi:hypothetical protein